MSSSKKKRIEYLDFIRGLAVVFMIITHVSAIFWDGGEGFVETLTWWGAAVCFTTFLFVSSVIYGIKLSAGSLKFNKELRRSLGILGGYYLVAVILGLISKEVVLSVSGLIDVAVFKVVPVYTEFILPFAFYPLVIWLLRGVFNRVLPSLWISTVLGLVVYVISRFLYSIDIGSGYAAVVQGLLIGHGDLHRFGVFMYFPVLVAGLYWGFNQKSLSRRASYYSGLTALVLAGIFAFFRITNTSGWSRWPPSLIFFIYGLFMSFGTIALWKFISKIRILVDTVSFLGIFSIGFYRYHLIISYIFAFLVGIKVQNMAWFWGILAVVTALSWIFVKIESKLDLYLNKGRK